MERQQFEERFASALTQVREEQPEVFEQLETYKEHVQRLSRAEREVEMYEFELSNTVHEGLDAVWGQLDEDKRAEWLAEADATNLAELRGHLLDRLDERWERRRRSYPRGWLYPVAVRRHTPMWRHGRPRQRRATTRRNSRGSPGRSSGRERPHHDLAAGPNPARRAAL